MTLTDNNTNFIIFTDDSEIIILYKTKQVFTYCIWKNQKASLILIVVFFIYRVYLR